jgi:DNA-binding transcriptional LysR family regulator
MWHYTKNIIKDFYLIYKFFLYESEMSLLRISLEQWQTFVSVIREGGYLNASLKLNKTQPSVSYSIQKIEQLLNVKLFEIQGRKSILTKQGRELYQYAASLIQLASDIELKAEGKINKIESRIRLAVDAIFPKEILMQALNEFSELTNETTVIVSGGILSGPSDLLEKNEVDIVITYKYPKDIIAEDFYETSSALYASSTHRLSQLNRTLNQSDLALERQIIVMDDNRKNSMDVGWLNISNAWYVNSLELKFEMLIHGLGYAWINEEYVANRPCKLVKLNLDVGSIRNHKLFLAYRSRDHLGENALRLIEILKKYAKNRKA